MYTTAHVLHAHQANSHETFKRPSLLENNHPSGPTACQEKTIANRKFQEVPVAEHSAVWPGEGKEGSHSILQHKSHLSPKLKCKMFVDMEQNKEMKLYLLLSKSV